MKLKDLLEVEPGVWQSRPIFEGEIIALDGRDGKVLFDSRRNKQEHIQKYREGKVIMLWPDVRCVKVALGNHFVPVMKCYLSHDSWKEDETE